MTSKKIAILASGTGTNAEALINYFRNKKSARVELIISNKADAGVFGIAEKSGVKSVHIPNEELTLEGKLKSILEHHEIDFVILAGFLRKIPSDLVNTYKGKIVNIHPALLPKFGGKGMYGRKVHEEVIRHEEEESGITIHHVTENYDEGDIIFQVKVKIEKGDTPETLEKKIHELEHKYYPEIVETLLS